MQGAPGRGASDAPRRPLGSAPVRVGDLLAEALPRRTQARLLDLEFLRRVWREAIPEPGTPEALDRGVLTVRAEDEATAAALHRRRGEIRNRLLDAAGLPGARLRVRVVAR